MNVILKEISDRLGKLYITQTGHDQEGHKDQSLLIDNVDAFGDEEGPKTASNCGIGGLAEGRLPREQF